MHMFYKDFSWFSKSEISIGINNFLFKTQYSEQQTVSKKTIKRQQDNTNKYVFLKKKTDNDSKYKILETRGGVLMAKDNGN